MLRFLTAALLLVAATSGCATAPEPARDPRDRRAEGPSERDIVERARSVLLTDAERMLGRAAAAEVLRAETLLLVRRPVQFPRMTQRPDGSWEREAPSVAAAVRTTAGWVLIGADGARHSFDRAAAITLDRLLAQPVFWTEPAVPPAMCTDPSGIVLMSRHHDRERISTFPCGLGGLTGEAAQIVLAGRISDWSSVAPDLRPSGLPLERFHESTQSRWRHMSGIHEQRTIAIRSFAEWEGQWRRLLAPLRAPPPPPPEVDFGREMLLMAAMGPQPRGGHSVVIDQVIDQDHELLAFVRFISPGPRCGAIAAVTSPVDIVRVPALTKNVRWVIERELTDCR
jgi:hypothetical protein